MSDKSALIKRIINSPSYQIAYRDQDFLRSENLRGIRFLLEYNKAESILKNEGVEHTIVLFGSARKKPGDEHYAAAYELAVKICQNCNSNTLICSGGGPGIMQAANHGALDSGKRSIGLNIEIPHEQEPNPYITPGLCFNFHYFAIRKMHFLRRTKAMIAFPGGFGTMDEMFETLTLIQTKKMSPIPIILFDQNWWQNIINFKGLVEAGTISETDLDLFYFADTAQTALEILQKKACACFKD